MRQLRVVSGAAERLPLQRAGHGHRSSAARRWSSTASRCKLISARGARARGHRAHERGERGARDLLPQQHPAPVRAALADRLRVSSANAQVSTWDIQRLARRIYPYIAAELFLRWSESELARRGRRRCSPRWRPCGLIEAGTGDRRLARAGARLRAGHAAVAARRRRPCRRSSATTWWSPSWCRPAAARSRRQTLEERCQLTARRMTLLYGLNSPEFFDRTMFGNFIGLLRERGVIRAGERRQPGVRRGPCPCGAGRTVRPQRAAAPQHPAGHACLKHLAAAPRRVID